MSVVRICPTCAYTHTYATPPIAAYNHPRHSCEKQLAQVERAQARAERGANVRPIDCQHKRVTHEHGTRNAYVADRCRCRHCALANAAAGTHAYRARAMGRWQPYVDAAPVREHIAKLREAGIGIDQIAKLSGLSSSNVRGLVYSARPGRPPYRRVRPETAKKLLAVSPAESNRAAHANIDATGTRRRLQALVAIGWTQAALADELGRTTANLARSMRSQRVTRGTAGQVAALYDRLWNISPPLDTGRRRRASATARTYAANNGWLPPLAWDDIDTDPHPSQPSGDTPAADDDLDEIAIERAIAGDSSVRLTRDEQKEVIRRMSERGQSIGSIAEQLSASKRTVSRHRRRIHAA